MKNPKWILPLILLSALPFLSGCASVEQTSDKADQMFRKNSHSIFNPKGLYTVPPQGLWVEDLVDASTYKRTGPIFIPPGAIVSHDDEAVDGKE